MRCIISCQEPCKESYTQLYPRQNFLNFPLHNLNQATVGGDDFFFLFRLAAGGSGGSLIKMNGNFWVLPRASKARAAEVQKVSYFLQKVFEWGCIIPPEGWSQVRLLINIRYQSVSEGMDTRKARLFEASVHVST